MVLNMVRRKGFSKILGVIFVLVFVAVALPLGIYIVDKINSAMPTASNTQLAQAQNSTISNIATAFDIFSITPLVMVAGLIIVILMSYLYVRSRQ